MLLYILDREGGAVHVVYTIFVAVIIANIANNSIDSCDKFIIKSNA